MLARGYPLMPILQPESTTENYYFRDMIKWPFTALGASGLGIVSSIVYYEYTILQNDDCLASRFITKIYFSRKLQI